MVETEPRVAMQIEALETVNQFYREASERIRRMSLAAADIEVKGSQRKGANGAGGLPGLNEIFVDDLAGESSLGAESAS